MATIQNTTNSIFRPLYDLIDSYCVDNKEKELSGRDIRIIVYDIERAVMLELIKSEALIEMLTGRVLLYSDSCDAIDELTGKSNE